MKSVSNENDFLYGYLWENQFREIPYSGQLSHSGHYILWKKVVKNTTYKIFALWDLRGVNTCYFLETVRDDQYSIRMFESNAEVELFGNSI
ncbi:hypothetical protein [Membranihabitans maritimus]|uniref:hypothetical protein n=1 Tax=Membranihabitans maritimus TaxID=2904244 RepID=UPI001F291E46|nr:hypothetical protein [Membranihabitans maritimus]